MGKLSQWPQKASKSCSLYYILSLLVVLTIFQTVLLTDHVLNQNNVSVKEKQRRASMMMLAEPERSPTCRLEPAWGADTGLSSSCVGRHPKNPFTTTTRLTCTNPDTIGSDIRPKLTRTSTTTGGITIALLYYAEPAMLLRQLEQFTSYPKDLREQLTLLVVDDGSPPGLKAEEYITLSHRQLMRIRIAHVQINKLWNTPGARNLAFHVADTANVLMIDSDLLVPLETMRAVLTWKIQQQQDGHHVAHQFNRTRLDGTYKTHPSAAYISVNAYWASGGCEEDFSGNYGSEDVAFWYHVEKHKNNQIVEHSEIFLQQFDKEACEGVPISTNKACREARKQLPTLPRYIEINQARLYSRIQKGCWSNRFLRFPWVLLEAE